MRARGGAPAARSPRPPGASELSGGRLRDPGRGRPARAFPRPDSLHRTRPSRRGRRRPSGTALGPGRRSPGARTRPPRGPGRPRGKRRTAGTSPPRDRSAVRNAGGPGALRPARTRGHRGPAAVSLPHGTPRAPRSALPSRSRAAATTVARVARGPGGGGHRNWEGAGRREPRSAEAGTATFRALRRRSKRPPACGLIRASALCHQRCSPTPRT